MIVFLSIVATIALTIVAIVVTSEEDKDDDNY